MWKELKHWFYYSEIDPLGFLGLDITSTAMGNQRFLKNPIRIIIFVLVHLFITSSMNLFIFLRPTHNILIDLQALCFGIQSILIWIKYFVLIMSGMKSQSLRASYNELAKEATKEESLILNNKLANANIFAKIAWTTAMLISSYHNIPPFISTLIAYFGETGEDLHLPFRLLLFWNTNQIVGYLIAYIMNAIYVLCCFNSIAGVDYLFYYYIEGCVGFHEILRLRIKHFAKLLDKPNYSEAQLQDYWRKIIVYHNCIKHIVNKINAFFAFLLLVHVILYLFILCLHVYLFVYNVDLVSQFVVFLTGIFYLFNLVVYCSGGQIISNASSRTSREIYLSIPWETLTPKLKKTFYIVLMCSQPTDTINSIFFVVDHPLLAWALKTTGSFTAALMALRDREAE